MIRIPRLVVLFLVLILAGASLAAAQSPSTENGGGQETAEPAAVTQVVKCEVTRVAEDGTVYVKDAPDAAEQALKLTPKTRIKARDVAQFDGRKSLTAADLKVGQKLQVTRLEQGGDVVKVVVLKS